MAIQVSGTEVISNSRGLNNIASLDATTTATINAVVGASDLAAATGGTVTTDGDYKVHKFTSDGTFSVTTAGPIDFLVVSGGGAGGSGSTAGGGGGGAGGALLGHLPASVTGNYTVVIGLGGQENTSRGNHGLKSIVIGPQLAVNFVPGGGAGRSEYFGATNIDGASGGGGDGLGEAPFGFDGGDDVSGHDGGPGGGGMGGAGQDGNPSSYNGQAGGAGVSYDITGSTVFYCGGGGGGARTSGATGGPGGSGVGGVGGRGTVVGTAPVANSGSGGGGGGGSESGNPTDGASGVVIFRYKFQ